MKRTADIVEVAGTEYTIRELTLGELWEVYRDSRELAPVSVGEDEDLFARMVSDGRPSFDDLTKCTGITREQIYQLTQGQLTELEDAVIAKNPRLFTMRRHQGMLVVGAMRLRAGLLDS